MTNRSADDSNKPEGVDLPQTIGSSLGKSSDEILAELFGTLNAKPPESVEINTDNKSKKSERYKHHKKNKKHKRKHKSKSKKSKHKQMSSTRSKASRSSSSTDTCDIGDASFHDENARPGSVDKSIPLCDTTDVSVPISKCPKPIEKNTSQNLCENAKSVQHEMQLDESTSDCSQSKKDLCSNDIRPIENVQPASNISNTEPINTVFCKEVSNNMEAAVGIIADVDTQEKNSICLSSAADATGLSVLTNVEQSKSLSRPKGDEGAKEPSDSSTAVVNKMTKGPNVESGSHKQSSSPQKKLGKRKEATPEQRHSHHNSKRRRSQEARHRSKSVEVNHQTSKIDRKSRDKDDFHGSKKKRSRSRDRRRRSRSCSKTTRSTDVKSSSRDLKRHKSSTKRKSRSHERGSQHDVKYDKKREESSSSKSKRKKTRSRSKDASKRSLSRDRSADRKSSKKNRVRSSSRGKKISQDAIKSNDPKRSVSMDRKTSENPKSVEKDIDSQSCEKDISDSSAAKILDENHCSISEEEHCKSVDNLPSMEIGNQMRDNDASSPRRDEKSSSPVVDGSEECANTDCKEIFEELIPTEDGVVDESNKDDECNDCDENQLEIQKKDSHSHESITTKNVAEDNHQSDKRRSKSTDSHSHRSRRKSKSRSRDKDSKRTSRRKQSKSKDRHVHQKDRRSRSRSHSKPRHNRRTKSPSKHTKTRSRSHSKHRGDKKSRSRSKHRGDKKSRSRSKHRGDKKSRTRSRSKHRSDKRSRSRSHSKHRSDKRSRSHSKHRSDKRSRSRSKQKSDKRSRSHSKHRSDKKSRSRSKHRSNRRSRSKSHQKRRKSISKEREDSKKKKTRSKSKDAERTKKSRSKSRDKDKSSRNERKSRSRSHDRSHRSSRKKRSRSGEVHIDKRKLFEIARKNAMSMLKQSVVPFGTENIVAIKAGGKSVEELTDFCKQLSKKEGGASSDENENDDERNSDSDVEKAFHHPFQLKERPTNIVLNIRNAVPVPTKTFQEKTVEQSKQLRLQFPVSSGQNHRKTESEWVPVEPSPASASDQCSSVQASSIASQLNQSLNQSLTQAVSSTVAAAAPSTGIPAVEAADVPSSSSVFPPTPASPPDIGNIVEKRVNAMRKLSANPNDSHAISQIYQVNQQMSMWLASKQQPGQFTGSTGAKVLTAAQLSTGYQAWAKKDQLVTAAPVTGGMGMALLKKMGWRPGEGLGKNKEGTLEPLKLEVKTDKKGLVAQEELVKRQQNSSKINHKNTTLAGKHPVSLLVEFCTKRHWDSPQFQVCFECGPDHKKNFLFKVRVNGIEYQPSVASNNKKQAKAEAARLCLQSLGLLYPDVPK